MDRCPHCNKRMKLVLNANGRTDFQCPRCDVMEVASNEGAVLKQQPLPSKAA